MREDAQTKGRRLVAEGRLTIRQLGDDRIAAVVRGDSAQVYHCGYDRSRWWCTCQALGRCSHIRALMLVVLEPVRVRGTGPNGD